MAESSTTEQAEQSDAGTIRILICEGQTLMREGLCTVLELEPGFAVVGAAADGAEGVRLASALCPDVVLMDIQMPRQNGVQATAAITALGLPSRIIILTTFDYEDYVFDAIKAGAVGYLFKDMPAAELATTIRRVAAGESFIQPNVATKLLMEFGRRSPSHGTTGDAGATADATGSGMSVDGIELLSQREVDVLRLLAQGRAIATSPISSCLLKAPSKITSRTSWQSCMRPTAPRRRSWRASVA